MTESAASMTIGKWSLTLRTKRTGFRSEREVRSSDTGDGGRGTLLRVEKRFCRLCMHTVGMKHANGDAFTLQVTVSGSRRFVTKVMDKGLTDIDGKPIPPRKESYTWDKACAYLGRILGIDAAVAANAILVPLPEAEEGAEETKLDPIEAAEVADLPMALV